MRDESREYDKTCLKIYTYDGVHRDYAAHFFRWGFIGSRVIQRGDRVLDIGCGVQAPLARLISDTEESLSILPSLYLGVDMNKVARPWPSGRKWARFIGEFNFAKNWRQLGEDNFNVIACLEVVEHMTMRNVVNLLIGAGRLLAPGGRLILSTPVFNGKAAKNHINEMTIEILQSKLDKTGWRVEKRFGTFASYNDIKRVATPAHLEVLDAIRAYYSGAVAACFLAPLYPDASRNNLWLCKRSSSYDSIEDLL